MVQEKEGGEDRRSGWRRKARRMGRTMNWWKEVEEGEDKMKKGKVREEGGRGGRGERHGEG